MVNYVSGLKPLRNGILPSSSANLNSHLTGSGIPSSNSAFARSIQDFTRILLGVEASHSNLPTSPPQSQLSTYHLAGNAAFTSDVALTHFCSYLSEHPLNSLEVGGRTKCIPLICRQFFVEDLAAGNVHHVSFAWEELPSSPYNKWFSMMVLKHWVFAKNNRLLHKYAIAPADDTASNASKVLYRWLHGRQEDLRQKARNPHWRQAKAAREKRSKRIKQVCLLIQFPLVQLALLSAGLFVNYVNSYQTTVLILAWRCPFQPISYKS